MWQGTFVGSGLIVLWLGVLLIGALVPTPGHPQPAIGAGTGEPVAVQPSAPRDPLERETPAGFVHGILRAMAAEDYGRAARYLDLSEIAASRREVRGVQLAKDLQKLLDKGGWVAANRRLSTDPAGRQDDGLPPEREQFATVRTSEGTVGLYAERVEDPDAGAIWLVSPETVREIPRLLDRAEVGILDRILPRSLVGGPSFNGVPVGHWLVLVLLAAAAYLVTWALLALSIRAIRFFSPRCRSARAVRLIDAAVLPLCIYLSVWIFALGSMFLGVSVIARQQLGYLAEIVAWVALGWFLWRIVEALGEIGMARMMRRRQFGTLSAVRFFRRSGKFMIVAVAGIAVLDTLGFDITAGIAALGIGGLAIALGAQKTIENLVGSLTVIADQPVRIGDFCRFGETLGTVEDIGMRSTRIRTLDRTVVTVPNGQFAALQIENYSRRDKFWFHPVLALRYETTPDQIRYLLVEIRSMLYGHPRVDPDPARVRFLGLGGDCLNVEIFAYVHAEDFSDFLEIQEDLALRIMDIVADSGASFALPSRTLYMAPDPARDEKRTQAAEERVRRWREEGDLRLPRFRPDHISALRGSPDYPPDGSVTHRRRPSP